MDRETRELLHKRADELNAKLHDEIDRLLRTGAVDGVGLNIILKVALENLADLYASHNSRDYRNLKKF